VKGECLHVLSYRSSAWLKTCIKLGWLEVKPMKIKTSLTILPEGMERKGLAEIEAKGREGKRRRPALWVDGDLVRVWSLK